MTSANNFRALFGLARPKLPFNFNILFKAVAQHGIDGGLIGAILLYFFKKQTGWVIINEVLMTFSGFVSYCKGTYDYDEYIATVYCIMC